MLQEGFIAEVQVLFIVQKGKEFPNPFFSILYTAKHF